MNEIGIYRLWMNERHLSIVHAWNRYLSIVNELNRYLSIVNEWNRHLSIVNAWNRYLSIVNEWNRWSLFDKWREKTNAIHDGLALWLGSSHPILHRLISCHPVHYRANCTPLFFPASIMPPLAAQTPFQAEPTVTVSSGDLCSLGFSKEIASLGGFL